MRIAYHFVAWFAFLITGAEDFDIRRPEAGIGSILYVEEA